MKRSVQSPSIRRQILTAVLLAHLLAVLVLAASPRLHHWLHPQENGDDGDCAVVLFQHAGAGTVPAPAWVPPVACATGVGPAGLTMPPAFVPAVFAVSRVFEHAPPPVS